MIQKKCPPSLVLCIYGKKNSTVEYPLLFNEGYANAMGDSYGGASEFELCQDPAGQGFLPEGVSSSVFAGRVVGDGNCFYTAISLRLFGTQVYLTVRSAICCSGCQYPNL